MLWSGIERVAKQITTSLVSVSFIQIFGSSPFFVSSASATKTAETHVGKKEGGKKNPNNINDPNLLTESVPWKCLFSDAKLIQGERLNVSAACWNMWGGEMKETDDGRCLSSCFGCLQFNHELYSKLKYTLWQMQPHLLIKSVLLVLANKASWRFYVPASTYCKLRCWMFVSFLALASQQKI